MGDIFWDPLSCQASDEESFLSFYDIYVVTAATYLLWNNV